MQAYATAERMPSEQLRVLDCPPPRLDRPSTGALAPRLMLDELLEQVAELVAERVAARLSTTESGEADEWLDTRRAAEHLGIHRDRLRRLAAEGAISSEQETAGCKLYFRRSDLDAWRSPSSPSVLSIRTGRHG
jgi:excisionase family DNA binding protein